jgi:hypothetical protein
MSKIFIEASEYSMPEYESIFQRLHENAAVISKKINTFQFNVTGVVIIDDMPLIIFPKGYSISTDMNFLKEESRNLLKTLIRYSEKSQEPEEAELLQGGKEHRNGRIVSAFALLDDFAMNGWIQRKIVDESSCSNGFVNWAKTINERIPIVSDNSVFYIDPAVKSLNFDRNNLISRIHKQVIQECYLLFGWLTDYDFDFEQIEDLELSNEELVIFLKQELCKTFVQREIYVINLLILFLSAQVGADENKSYEIFATRFFQNVWEDICGSLLVNEYNSLKVLVPSPKWEDFLYKTNISQRPDIMFTEDDALYVVDAKFYDYKQSTPGWHDIVKQFFYTLTINQNLKYNPKIQQNYGFIKKVFNIFIMPENEGFAHKRLGEIHVEHVEIMEKIYVFSFNMKKALDLYAKREPNDSRSLLISTLEHLMIE